MSEGAKKLMDMIKVRLASYRQKQGSRSGRIIYDGEEFCEASSIEFDGIPVDCEYLPEHELHYDSVGKDFNTGKPYTRKAEIANVIKDIKGELKSRGIKYTAKNIARLKGLLEHNDALRYDELMELIGHVQPQRFNTLAGRNREEKTGHQHHFFARRVNDLEDFLKYLPQLVREYYVLEHTDPEYWHLTLEKDDKGRWILDYDGMQEPFLSLAFKDNNTHPITFVDIDPQDWNSGQRPVYYAEYVGLPTVEIGEFELNPIAA
jgi:hypothetical protein